MQNNPNQCFSIVTATTAFSPAAALLVASLQSVKDYTRNHPYLTRLLQASTLIGAVCGFFSTFFDSDLETALEKIVLGAGAGAAAVVVGKLSSNAYTFFANNIRTACAGGEAPYQPVDDNPQPRCCL